MYVVFRCLLSGKTREKKCKELNFYTIKKRIGREGRKGENLSLPGFNDMPSRVTKKTKKDKTEYRTPAFLISN